MPAKKVAATPMVPVQAPAAAAAPKTRKPRAKADRNALPVALWIGPSAKPKKWFATVADAKAYLAGQSGLAGQEVHLAELKKVTLSFAINIEGTAQASA